MFFSAFGRARKLIKFIFGLSGIFIL